MEGRNDCRPLVELGIEFRSGIGCRVAFGEEILCELRFCSGEIFDFAVREDFSRLQRRDLALGIAQLKHGIAECLAELDLDLVFSRCRRGDDGCEQRHGEKK